MREPNLRPENLEARLRNVVQKKKVALGGLQDKGSDFAMDFESVKPAGSISEALDLLEGDPNDMKQLRQFQVALGDLLALCDEIQGAESPQENIKQMQEILIQKDDEWIATESEEDPRYLFFYTYFAEKSGGHQKPKDILDNLRTHRFDQNFLDEVSAMVDQIRYRADGVSKSVKLHIGPSWREDSSFREHLARRGTTAENRIASIDKRINETQGHITCLSDLIDSTFGQPDEK